MAKHSNNMAIPVEVQRLRLCSSLQGCGGNVTLCLKESDAPLISIYDDETLGFSDWEVGNNGCPKSFLAHNNAGKNIVLLPLDNKIITGPKIKQGGVADCAVLTLSDMSFIEFKTNVTSNSEENINSKIEDAMYFAAEPKPGVWSVSQRSLSTVFGIQMMRMSLPIVLPYSESFQTVSMESFPPM